MAKKKKADTDAEQLQIPGMEEVKNPRVHPKAVRYAKLRNARMEANEEEKAAHDTLLDAMISEGLENYSYKGLTVAIDATKKCKVKTDSGSAPAKGDDEDE